MQRNILKSTQFSSLYIIYKDELKHKFKVDLRFMDTQECYLATELPPEYKKPKNNIQAELVAYTQDGIYKSIVKIVDSSVTFNNILFTISLPETWNFTQMRMSTRKEVTLPFSITFNDGYLISGSTFDLSSGGVSFISETEVPNLYTKVSGNLSIFLSSDLNTKDKVDVDVKFLRSYKFDKYSKDTVYVYKFINVSKTSENRIKSFLINLT